MPESRKEEGDPFSRIRPPYPDRITTCMKLFVDGNIISCKWIYWTP